MKTYSRSKAPSYIALSYTWGPAPYQKGRPASLQYSITLNDEIFPVQQNLYDALRHLGKHVRKRKQLFWVDALCINQEDLGERSAQVRQMKEIYECADGVFAWLGVPFDEEETRLGVELMREFNVFLRTELQNFNDDIGTVLMGINESHPSFPTTPGTKVWVAWDGIAEMLNQPYWHRVWIYQEATTPGEILFFCGEHSFDDVLLCATITLATTFSRILSFPVRFVEAGGPGGSAGDLSSARIARQKRNGGLMIDLLQQMRKAGCTNPSDRVYAPLGHAVDISAGRIAVDYSTSPVDLYVEVMRYLVLESVIGLDALGFVFMPAEDSSNQYLRTIFEPAMPSWVPEWRQRVSILGFSHKRYQAGDHPLYDPAPGPSDARIKNVELHVQGFVIDSLEITFLTSIFADPKGSWTTPLSWYKDMMGVGLDPSGLGQAIRRSLVADRSIAERGTTRNGFTYTWKRGGAVDWSLFERRRDSLDEESLVTLDNMEQAMFNVCYGRRMALLGGTVVAVLPSAAKSGDNVAAVIGGHALYLLRKVQGGFNILGECYVDGRMDGSLMRGTSRIPNTLCLI
ncbi:hypothetical protein SLS60_000968 [Paraconiothyrium brasiliense]|uniref:Heterokaryon incompatibility domain-containing protein n=1 Tax=Paraconiothyrium brasiliense TaxID=300254 RepID=A0ABR3S7R8_9PLEO